MHEPWIIRGPPVVFVSMMVHSRLAMLALHVAVAKLERDALLALA